MYTGLIATRYATALADFAAANGEERAVYDDVRRLIAAYGEDVSVRAALYSPVLPAAAKQALLRQALDGKVSPTFDRFIELVLRHHREKYLHFMLHSYVGVYKRRHGIVEAVLTTATPVSDESAERIAAMAQMRTHSRDVELHRTVDPSLVGGFVFRMEDLLVDASLSRQLGILRRQFGNNRNRIV
ncbi:F0F1 ATP synthase subunit delta [Alistipes sp.]|uniref:F0F1 ATP synthase subunit delta n=1 Tax=Alistipes sp. TaxID=1872444 RepID=UPI003AB770CF